MHVMVRTFQLLSMLLASTTAFQIAPRASVRASSLALAMAPKYDKMMQLWTPQSPDEGPEGGYGIGRTLLLHGPKPFFSRLFQPADYEQAVLKFMANDKVGRVEAQGNMDAYLDSKYSAVDVCIENKLAPQSFNLFFALSFLNAPIYRYTDAQDWAFNRFEEQRTGVKRNYTEINTQQLILTVVWGSSITGLGVRAIWSLTTGNDFWSFLHL
jgi:hypothetical protein